jgi:hypothetical protein
MDAQHGFAVGDRVVAFTDDYDERDTWRVVKFTKSLLSQSLVTVEHVEHSGRTTVFYPHELQHDNRAP